MLPKASLFALSILVAGVIGLFKFKKIDGVYYPFLLMVWLACFNEILSCYLMVNGHYTVVNNNVYVLAEALLFSWFFKKLGLFERRPWLFVVLVAGLGGTWIWENFLYSHITNVSSWFRIVYSSVIVMMSITVLNRLIISDINKPLDWEGGSLLKNPLLLICIASIGYFTFKVLVEVFWLYGESVGKVFRIRVFHILMYVNFAANLIYALAVLWAKPRQRYMTIY